MSFAHPSTMLHYNKVKSHDQYSFVFISVCSCSVMNLNQDFLTLSKTLMKQPLVNVYHHNSHLVKYIYIYMFYSCFVLVGILNLFRRSCCSLSQVSVTFQQWQSSMSIMHHAAVPLCSDWWFDLYDSLLALFDDACPRVGLQGSLVSRLLGSRRGVWLLTP